MTKRILINISIFLSALFLPWWITLIFILLLVFSFIAPEILVWGFFIDVLYAAPVAPFLGFEFIFTFFFLFLYFVAHYLKKRLVFYSAA